MLIDLEKIDLTQFRVLGSDLWGSVLDLADGTVVKLAKRYCAGIGDGLDKIEREYAVLKALNNRHQSSPICVPREFSWGGLKRNDNEPFSASHNALSIQDAPQL